MKGFDNFSLTWPEIFIGPAEVAELADARDLKSSRKKKGLFRLIPTLPATYCNLR
jgi:hypothetical protein